MILERLIRIPIQRCVVTRLKRPNQTAKSRIASGYSMPTAPKGPDPIAQGIALGYGRR